MYRVFVRDWYKKNPNFPGGLEPHAGRKTVLYRVQTIDEARSICQQWNSTHDPGKLSRKAEFERV